MADTGVVTGLLRQWAEGDPAARERIVPLVYETLCKIAGGYLAGERHANTLQPTALVHEAYLRLVDQSIPDWQNRDHFYGVAASLMRQILVDHARARLASKRGAGAVQVEFDEALGLKSGNMDRDLVALGDSLSELEKVDPRRGKIIELRYFGGFTEEETARSLGISVATVRRESRLAEAWLYTQMHRAS